MRKTRNRLTWSLILSAVALTAGSGCATFAPYGPPGQRVERLGDEIVVCGQLFHTGTPVILWTDPHGYDAYRAHCHFNPQQWQPKSPVSDDPVRYSSWRRNVPEDALQEIQQNGWDLPKLQEYVDQFVLHYDVCGTSRQCFKVLHDLRGLSVHFMLDVDGTIYQTLDLKERAWHAGSANDRSVGIEIANIGAYKNMDTLNKWYGKDKAGRPYITFPEALQPTGIRTADFVAYPARPEPVVGVVQDSELRQYDYTPQQYAALAKLTATLCQVLPKIKPDYPRDEAGRLITRVLTADEMQRFQGVLGHYHITKQKVDPGPALDWDKLLGEARRLMRQRGAL